MGACICSPEERRCTFKMLDHEETSAKSSSEKIICLKRLSNQEKCGPILIALIKHSKKNFIV